MPSDPRSRMGVDANVPGQAVSNARGATQHIGRTFDGLVEQRALQLRHRVDLELHVLAVRLLVGHKHAAEIHILVLARGGEGLDASLVDVAGLGTLGGEVELRVAGGPGSCFSTAHVVFVEDGIGGRGLAERGAMREARVSQ